MQQQAAAAAGMPWPPNHPGMPQGAAAPPSNSSQEQPKVSSGQGAAGGVPQLPPQQTAGENAAGDKMSVNEEPTENEKMEPKVGKINSICPLKKQIIKVVVPLIFTPEQRTSRRGTDDFLINLNNLSRVTQAEATALSSPMLLLTIFHQALSSLSSLPSNNTSIHKLRVSVQQLINVTVAVLLIVGHFVIVAVAESAKSSRSLTLIAPSISFAYHQTSPSSSTTHNRRHVHSIQTHCVHHQTLLQSSSINYQSKLQMNQSKHGYHRRETAKTSNLESNGGGGDYVLDLGASFGKSTKSSVADFTSKEFSSDEITIELNDTKMSNKHNQQTDELEDDNEDDNSEANNPRRGRPGIVVFSGGTAFNSAAAEMASRIISVGVGSGFEGDTNGEGEISRMNSLNSLVDLMTLGRMDGMGTDKAGGVQTTTSAITDSNLGTHNQGVAIAGGTKVWHVLPVTDDGGSTAEIVRVLGGPAVGDIRSNTSFMTLTSTSSSSTAFSSSSIFDLSGVSGVIS